jgi:hypothetical protein
MSSSCASPGDPDYAGSVSLTGTVTKAGEPARAYVRLLNKNADFVAEVPAGADGGFTFYTVPGEWILRAITSAGTHDRKVTISGPTVDPVAISVG